VQVGAADTSFLNADFDVVRTWGRLSALDHLEARCRGRLE
jgi:hypothetical protein